MNFRQRKVEKAKKTREQLDEEKKEEEKDPVILDETIEVGRRPRRKAKPEDVNNPNNFIGRRVRRKFNDGEFYTGDIFEYDDPFFRISYEDGQEEDMSLRDVKRYLVKPLS